MFRKIIFGLTIGIIVTTAIISNSSCLNSHNSEASEVGMGTLIVIVPAKNGIVICSDKRIYRKSTGDVDTMNKLNRVAEHSAFAVVGAPIVWSSGRKIFDSFDIVKDFFDKKEIVDTDTTWTGIQNILTQTFRDNVLSLKYIDWPESQYPQKNYVLFEIIFFHSNFSGVLSMSLIQFTYIKNTEPIYKTSVYSLSAKGSFTAFGSAHVIFELQTGKDKRFDKFRNDKKLEPFLSNSLLPDQISNSEAKYFAQKMIQISSANYSLISDLDAHISPNCDCAILDAQKGFTWLNSN